MRRFRNPRYAPEGLERRLSPSGAAGLPVAAVVHIPSTQSNPSLATIAAPSKAVVVVPINPAVAPIPHPSVGSVAEMVRASSSSSRHCVTLDDPAPTGPSIPDPDANPPGGGTDPSGTLGGVPTDCPPTNPGSPGGHP